MYMSVEKLGSLFLLLCSDLKVIVLGSSGVGKTCLLQRYISNTFSDCESVRNSISLVDSIVFILCYTQTIGASLAMRKWGNLNVALWVSYTVYYIRM